MSSSGESVKLIVAPDAYSSGSINSSNRIIINIVCAGYDRTVGISCPNPTIKGVVFIAGSITVIVGLSDQPGIVVVCSAGFDVISITSIGSVAIHITYRSGQSIETIIFISGFIAQCISYTSPVITRVIAILSSIIIVIRNSGQAIQIIIRVGCSEDRIGFREIGFFHLSNRDNVGFLVIGVTFFIVFSIGYAFFAVNCVIFIVRIVAVIVNYHNDLGVIAVLVFSDSIAVSNRHLRIRIKEGNCQAGRTIEGIVFVIQFRQANIAGITVNIRQFTINTFGNKVTCRIVMEFNDITHRVICLYQAVVAIKLRCGSARSIFQSFVYSYNVGITVIVVLCSGLVGIALSANNLEDQASFIIKRADDIVRLIAVCGLAKTSQSSITVVIIFVFGYS